MNHELEWQTRRERINTKLTSLPQPWAIIRYKDGLDTEALGRCAVEEYPTKRGPADYALFVQGTLLGYHRGEKGRCRAPERAGTGGKEKLSK